jgi:gas vesicle protein
MVQSYQEKIKRLESDIEKIRVEHDTTIAKLMREKADAVQYERDQVQTQVAEVEGRKSEEITRLTTELTTLKEAVESF